MKNVSLKTFLSLSFALFIVFSSCKKEDESPKNPLVGTWLNLEVEEENDYRYEHRFIFNSDMTGAVDGVATTAGEVIYEVAFDFTYTFTATEVTLKDGENTSTFPYTVTATEFTLFEAYEGADPAVYVKED
ncbi:hypothetical protein QWY31_13830 [Cytophagales bacterium LB-30]|uniref:Lipocalin-like domain-containing protein n=1 Tax=Shiella aurantiaca TaxID=3058365 RepID=A0ABT8F8K9_9BACT|nr:hypothetical protein [Shiella aurantiaca]MDN4166584.1 hypothetical protein [Shiella aurantiaca]